MTEMHDWRLYALESHCVDCELKLRDHIATLEDEVARLMKDVLDRENAVAYEAACAFAAERRTERFRVALTKIAQHPQEVVVHGRPDLGIPGWPSCQSTARAALEETQ